MLPVFGNHVVQHAQDVALLAEGFLLRGFGQQPARGRPALVVEALAHVRGAGLVARGEERIAEGVLQVRGIVERAKVLKRGHAGFAALRRRWGSPAHRDPVNEAPPRHLVQQAVGLFVVGKPVENGARAGHQRAGQAIRVRPVHPVVVQHAHIEQREGGDGLRQGTGIAAARDAFRNARVVEGVEAPGARGGRRRRQRRR